MTSTANKQPSPATSSSNQIVKDKAPKLPSLQGQNWLLHLYYIRKDFKQCKEIIKEQLASTNGMCEYAMYVQALIMRQEGRIQESLELFQSCSIINPANILNLKQVARSLFLLARYKAAIDVFNETLKYVPVADWEITHNLGICYWHLKNKEKAKQYFKEAITMSKNEQSFLMLAKIFIKEGQINTAIEILQKASEFNVESSDVLTSLGLLYMKERQYQKSFEALGNALTFNPTHYKAILAVCNMIQIHNDHDVALNKYRIAADTAPESPRLWNNIGMCFLGKKKYVAAISCLKRATYLSPFEWKILYNLGLVHLAMQQYASAFRYLNSAVNFKPNEAIIYSLLAGKLTFN
jgi:Bardet-Biedl syndrome 4 protein